MTKLEAGIRDALRSRADTVTVGAPELRGRARRRPDALLAAAAVALVLAIVGVVFAVRGGGTGQPGPVTGVGGSSYVGHRWRLSTIDDKYGRLPVVDHGTIAFAPDGTFTADDTVNFYGGRYRVVWDGYTISELTGTLAGAAQMSPRNPRARVIAAMATILNAPVHVLTRVSQGRLAVHVANGPLLTFVLAGPQRDEPAPSGTGTATTP